MDSLIILSTECKARNIRKTETDKETNKIHLKNRAHKVIFAGILDCLCYSRLNNQIIMLKVCNITYRYLINWVILSIE